MLSIITIIYHEVHSYQCYEMPLTSCNEIRRINHLLVSYSENYPGGEGGGGWGGEAAVLPHITHRYEPPQRVCFWCRFGLKIGVVQRLENRWTSFITRFRHNLYERMGCLFNLLITLCCTFLLNGRMTHTNGSFHSHNISLLKKSWLLFFYTTVCLSGLVILL